MYSISQKFAIRLDKLYDKNRMNYGDKVKEGQIIYLKTESLEINKISFYSSIMIYQRSSALFEEAYQYIPGGVNSPSSCFFKSVGGVPIFMKSAKRCLSYRCR